MAREVRVGDEVVLDLSPDDAAGPDELVIKRGRVVRLEGDLVVFWLDDGRECRSARWNVQERHGVGRVFGEDLV